MNLSLDCFQAILVFLLGLEFGSFANVCIYRWPRSASVVSPRRSFCPWCSHQISWIENIPVLSFVFLRGRCRHCASPISFRYPLVELSVAALWLSAHRVLGPVTSVTDGFFLAGIFGFLFAAVVTTLTDLDWRLIPDEASALLVGAGLLSAVANPLLGATAVERLGASFLGLAVSGGSVWLIGAVGSRLLSREAMGGGDVKLMAGIGAVLGWQGALFTLFVAAFLGGVFSLIGLLSGRLKRGQHIPFGPFLNAAGVGTLFYLLTGGELLSLIERFSV